MTQNPNIYKQFVENLDKLFLGFNEDQEITSWNQYTEDVTGYTNEELSNMTVDDLFREEDVRDIRSLIEKDEVSEQIINVNLIDCEGEYVKYRVNFNVLSSDQTQIYTCKEIEKLSGYDLDIFDKFFDIISDKQLSFSQRLDKLLDFGCDNLNFSYGAFAKIKNSYLRMQKTSGISSEQRTKHEFKISDTYCGEVIDKQKTVVKTGLETSTKTIYGVDGISSYIGMPVFEDNRVYGLVCFFDEERKNISDVENLVIRLLTEWISSEFKTKKMQGEIDVQTKRIERFASTAAHDLRNPLGVIVGRTGVLKKDLGDNDHIKAIERATKRMEDMISNMLLLAQTGDEVNKEESVSVEELCRESWNSIETGDATLNIVEDVVIEADPVRMKQLFDNLFRNSIKHGGEDVDISVGKIQPILTSTRSDNEKQTGFFVEDDGSGIDKEIKDEIFTAGYTTSKKGSGFGLSIVKEISNTNGFSVNVSESSSGGARFEFIDTYI